MKLKDSQIRNAKPKEKQYQLSDGGNLYLIVAPNGSKYWRFFYRINGKGKTLALGVYPQVSLKQARTKLYEAKLMLADGKCPSTEKQKAKNRQILDLNNTFSPISKEWFELKSKGWGADHTKRTKALIKNDILPKLGDLNVADITSLEVLAVIRSIESRGSLDMADQALGIMDRIFIYANVTGRSKSNPAYGLRAYLAPRTTAVQHHRHVSKEQLPELLYLIDSYGGRIETIIATKLILLTFVRSSELRNGRWEQIKWEEREWHIPSQQMKGRLIDKSSGQTHIVPLSTQSIALLKDLYSHTGRGALMFPSTKGEGKVMSDGTINKLLKSIGFHTEQTTHGFRGLASTLLNESGLFNDDAIERQLSHKDRNKIRRAYNHAKYLDERHELMQWWGDFLQSQGLSTSSSQ